jgi:hypothetical protein
MSTKINKVKTINTKIAMKNSKTTTKEKMNSSKNQHENTIINITNMNVKNMMHHEHQHLAPQRIKLI